MNNTTFAVIYVLLGIVVAFVFYWAIRDLIGLKKDDPAYSHKLAKNFRALLGVGLYLMGFYFFFVKGKL